MNDKEIWLMAYLAAIAGNDQGLYPWDMAERALAEYKVRWGEDDERETQTFPPE